MLLRKCLLAALLCWALPAAQAAPCPVDVTAASLQQPSAQFVTSDIDLFWRAHDLAQAGKAEEVFEREYLGKGSPGLAQFNRLRIGGGKQLAAAIRNSPRYFGGLRKGSLQVKSYQPQMEQALRCLRQLYPEATLPPVYFLIGSMNSAGTLDANGLYIGVDMFGKAGAGSLDELGPWHKAVISSIDRIPYIVAHEVIHFQQDYAPDETLLAHSIREGVADFVGQLIAGEHINPHLHAFAHAQQPELWAEFEQEMGGKPLANWLYQGEKARKNRPADLGYYMGYKIAEAYYRKQPDPRQAVRDMLKIRDFPAFLKASGYAQEARQAGAAGSNR